MVLTLRTTSLPMHELELRRSGPAGHGVDDDAR